MNQVCWLFCGASHRMSRPGTLARIRFTRVVCAWPAGPVDAHVPLSRASAITFQLPASSSVFIIRTHLAGLIRMPVSLLPTSLNTVWS
jgi:hypothetical protein